MQKDGLLTLADAQSVAGASSALFEHVIDQGSVQDLANGQQLFAVVTVLTTFTGGATETIGFRLCYNSDETATLASIYLNPLLGQSSYIGIAEMVAGKQIVIPLAPWTLPNGTAFEFTAGELARRYVTGAWHSYVAADLAASTFTADALVAGTFDLHLTRENPRGQKYYPRSTLSDGNVVKFG